MAFCVATELIWPVTNCLGDHTSFLFRITGVELGEGFRTQHTATIALVEDMAAFGNVFGFVENVPVPSTRRVLHSLALLLVSFRRRSNYDYRNGRMLQAVF